MKVSSIVVLVISFYLVAAGCSNQVYLSQRTAPGSLTDGQRTEWTGLFYIPENEKFAIAVTHDPNYLYVAISSINDAFSKQVSLTGLTIWLDPDGKNRQDLGISFSGQRSMAGHLGKSLRNLKSNPEGFSLSGDIDLTLMDTRTGQLNVPADLLATAGTENHGLFIEYQIPLIILGDTQYPQKLSLGLTPQDKKFRDIENRGASIRGSERRKGSFMGADKSMGMNLGAGEFSRGQKMAAFDLDLWLHIQFAE